MDIYIKNRTIYVTKEVNGKSVTVPFTAEEIAAINSAADREIYFREDVQNRLENLYDTGKYTEALLKDAELENKLLDVYAQYRDDHDSGSGADDVWDWEAAMDEAVKDCQEDIEKYRSDSFQIVQFGHYPQTKNGDVLPIDWLVLKREGDKALLLSKFALFAGPYNKAVISTATTWAECSLRCWLNDSFIRVAFTQEEQAAIFTTTVHTPDNPKHYASGGDDTKDNVFLLDIGEVQELIPDDKNRCCKASPWMLNCGWSAKGDLCWWWLRSPGWYSSLALCINHDGISNVDGQYVNTDHIGVRPALWVNLKSKSFESDIAL